MQVVVTGASSALGQAMLQAIAERGALRRGDGEVASVQRIIAVDRVQPATLFLDTRVEYVRGDYEQPRFLARMMGMSIDSVFHLSALGAGIGSGPASADLNAALLRSFDTTRAVLDACRFQSVPPKLVLASSLEVKPEADPWPQTTDGLCLALCELLVVESARRGIVDARCVRLPCLFGNRSCRQDLALQALLADIAAGRA
ncbi:MAG TPA: NAD-dependent epimerase/dehydratase family protein, partial [Burkholderiaceae bacterium]|nr:NAD-dependent epimerase/dehydratase family protein [Burkholderiaceae bacterium]